MLCPVPRSRYTKSGRIQISAVQLFVSIHVCKRPLARPEPRNGLLLPLQAGRIFIAHTTRHIHRALSHAAGRNRRLYRTCQRCCCRCCSPPAAVRTVDCPFLAAGAETNILLKSLIDRRDVLVLQCSMRGPTAAVCFLDQLRYRCTFSELLNAEVGHGRSRTVTTSRPL